MGRGPRRATRGCPRARPRDDPSVWARRLTTERGDVLLVGHLPNLVPASPPQALRPVIDAEERWAIARRLVADDTIAVDDRVAAALVVLYAQPLSLIAVFKTGDIHRSPDGTVIVGLAGNPVSIHEPIATRIGKLPHRRSNGVSDQPGTPWLFPSRHAGPVVLGERLRAIGIEPIRMRKSARARLAAQIPPALLGELIGVNATTATRWAALTAGNWTTYAAGLDSGADPRVGDAEHAH
jgi:hypothetical protein